MQLFFKEFIKIGLFFVLFCPKPSVAQNCKNYAPDRFGTEWQITNFNKKGILQSTTEAKIVSLKTVDSTGLEAVVEQVFLDKKDQETGVSNYKFRCQNNAIFVELPGVLPPQILGAYQNLDLVSSGKPVEFPEKMEAGQFLPEATIEMQARSGSLIVSKMVFLMTKRQVTGRETVNTMAGDFDCLKIEYDLESRFGAVVVKRKCKLWIAENVGMVKSESYKKGKLEGSQQLTAFRLKR